jgi:hypothetical protein
VNPIEQVIYGTTYAQRLAELLSQRPPSGVVQSKSDDAYERWQLTQAVSAIESAARAVERFREARPQVIEGFKGSSVHKLYVVATKR